jgi:Protein-glutamine gamma-glutamyltransferase
VFSLGKTLQFKGQNKSMNCPTAWLALHALDGGIWLNIPPNANADRPVTELTAWLQAWGLEAAAQTLLIPLEDGNVALICHLRPEFWQAYMPGHDTLALQARLNPGVPADDPWALEREICLALLGSPHRFQFASLAALDSHIRVRRNMALAARKTALAFKTEAAERPAADWHYEEASGFILKPGRPLIDALIAATQPEFTGKLYDFSCYRATEYVILLGIAQEVQAHHPAMLEALQQLNEHHAVRSGQFHDVFLTEYGSMQNALPARFYVPGDRLWFRNPDEHSSDVTGYEGSWVVYMGGGLFSNFWERDRPYTLESKAIEIFHWKDAVYTDAQGALQMDESKVAMLVTKTQRDPEARARVLERMLRMRDPKGVYAEGGCIDTTREYPRSVSREHCELVLPQL